MIRFVIPLIAVIAIFPGACIQSVFTYRDWSEERYTLVPRFVIVYLIFIAVYYDRQTCNHLWNRAWTLV